jgi:hypothetical protein
LVKNKFIGVDFSLNSPGVCILENDKAQWISVHRTKNFIPRLLKKEGSPFSIFGMEKDFSINVIEKESYEGEYHEKERDKIVAGVAFANLVFEKIRDHIDENTYIGIEGLSFGSSGNSLIDISMTTALLRERIIGIIDPNRFFVIAPTTVKKFAFKGNAKKDQLYLSLIEKGDKRLSTFTKKLELNQDKWIKKGGKVEDPCSDIIDATWISLYIEEHLEKLLG